MWFRPTVCLIFAAVLPACNGIDSPFKQRLSLAEAEKWMRQAEDTDRQRLGINKVGASGRGSDAAARAMGRNAPLDDTAQLVALLTEGRSVLGPAGRKWRYNQPPFVRWEAARALQRLHAPRRAIAGLVESLGRDPDEDVRRACAEALGQYAEQAVFTALVSALMRDRDYGVVEACVESLALLTGQNFGEDGSAWLAWERDQKDPFAGRKPYLYPTFRRNPHLWEIPDLFFPPANRPKMPRGLALGP